MEMISGKAKRKVTGWERLGWGCVVVFLGPGWFAFATARSWHKELEGFPWTTELSNLQRAVEHATRLMDRTMRWWWIGVVCWGVAVAGAVLALRKRKERLKAEALDAEGLVQTENE